MARRVLFVVAVAFLAVALLPWNATLDHLHGVRTVMTLTWWRRRLARLRAKAPLAHRRPGAV